jgi:RNA polymerase sigma factor (sigma-70 family)
MQSVVGETKDYTLFKQAQGGDSQARHDLIEQNMGLVHKFLSQGKYAWNRSELESVAVMGLMRAIDSFDPTKAKFSTWATYWINALVTREYGKIVGNITITQQANTMHNAVASARESLIADGKKPTVKEIAGMTRMTEKKVAAYSNRPETVELGEDHSNYACVDVDETLAIDVAVDIREAINSLPVSDVDKQIVAMRFGLTGETALSAINIAKELGLKSAYVYQALREAIVMLADSPVLIDYRP